MLSLQFLNAVYNQLIFSSHWKHQQVICVLTWWVDPSHISPQSWLFRGKKHSQCNLSCRKVVNKSLRSNYSMEFVSKYYKHTIFKWLYSKRIFSLLCSLTWEVWNCGVKYNFKTYFLIKWGYYPTAWSHPLRYTCIYDPSENRLINKTDRNWHLFIQWFSCSKTVII